MFLLLQRCVRSLGDYSYLEIGSYLGGTLQCHLVDRNCVSIVSVDKRPETQPDARGVNAYYGDTSAQSMLQALERAYSGADLKKILTFDTDASELDPAEFKGSVDLILIDGEHTNVAVARDFDFCLHAKKNPP